MLLKVRNSSFLQNSTPIIRAISNELLETPILKPQFNFVCKTCIATTVLSSALLCSFSANAEMPTPPMKLAAPNTTPNPSKSGSGAMQATPPGTAKPEAVASSAPGKTSACTIPACMAAPMAPAPTNKR